MFIDFTGSLVQMYQNNAMYSAICSVANPEGNLQPCTLFETILSDMTGNMIKGICTEFVDKYEELMGGQFGGSRTIYIHSDMFKGTLHQIFLNL